MEQLKFNTRVLGKKAAERLVNHQVTQTIRSESASICQRYFNWRLKPADAIEVYLDGHCIGVVTFLNLDPVKWQNLDINDALRGGFDNRFELASALKRAGYRFKDLEEYFFWRLIFFWPEKEKEEERSHHAENGTNPREAN